MDWILRSGSGSDSESESEMLDLKKVFTSIQEAMEWLTSEPGGGSPGNPVPLAMKIPLGAMPSSEWDNFLIAIAATGKYVSLDLSDCSMSNNEFDPYNANDIGQSNIVSLILPNQAQSIAPYSSSNATFSYFNNLSYVSGNNIATIGYYAFWNLPSLGTVSFPKATYIDEGAFCGSSLVNANLPAATSIMNDVFINCTSLTSINFPELTFIGGNAFEGCTALVSANLPKVSEIWNTAFAACTALTSVYIPAITEIWQNTFASTGTMDLTITMGAIPPLLYSDIFFGISSTKNVVVKIPDTTFVKAAYGFDDNYSGNYNNSSTGNWGADFKDANNNIILNYETY
ncbi:MAG: leucine-rich repeat domain-containing protein [Spirochaetaceae bacterium]|nr:leucine-rich repeat domain-containing protein [Spirochaetaceae bacterium]